MHGLLTWLVYSLYNTGLHSFWSLVSMTIVRKLKSAICFCFLIRYYLVI